MGGALATGRGYFIGAVKKRSDTLLISVNKKTEIIWLKNFSHEWLMESRQP
jgi:hypothetical protein